jgi:flagellar motor switch protein FliG
MKYFNMFERAQQKLQSLTEEQQSDKNVQKKILDAIVKELADELKTDNNLLAKSIAAYVRCGMEDFHAKHLNDEQMKELNPIIRNSIFTFLEDYASDNIAKIAGCITLNMSMQWEDCEYIDM